MMVSELLDKFTNEILRRNPYGNPAWSAKKNTMQWATWRNEKDFKVSRNGTVVILFLSTNKSCGK